jgi:single-stranded-DNA-specific exonuclease
LVYCVDASRHAQNATVSRPDRTLPLRASGIAPATATAPQCDQTRHRACNRQHIASGGSPRDIISGEHAETAILRSAREEVNAALKVAKRTAPRIRNGVALILFDSPCQLHPLIAQAWRGRLKDQIVIAANSGYRPGWVHFSARSARGINLLEFLREKAPAGADENYGSGHEQATGGALRPDAWDEFVGKLGFGPEARVPS